VEDHEVIEAFLTTGTRRAFGPTVHVEGEALMLDGWWHASLRVSPATFMLRNEEAPRPDTTLLEDLVAALGSRGLANVATDLPGMTLLTYTQLSLGYVSWTLWAPDAATGHADLEAKASEETSLVNSATADPIVDPDYSAELGGARRVAGLPPAVVLAVGIDQARSAPVESKLGHCTFTHRRFGEIRPDACGALVPQLIMVDTTTRQGEEFVMELRASACGRSLPVLAVATGAVTPLGASEAVDPEAEPSAWVDALERLLP